MSTFRSGVIPFSLVNNKLVFLFGIDKKYNEYTDFGGRSEENESKKQCALREFNEETCYLFKSDISLDKIQNSYIISDFKNTMYFIYLDEKWYYNKYINVLFSIKQAKLCHRKYNEISSLAWIKQEDFKDFFDYNNNTWRFITKFLRNNTTYYDILSGVRSSILSSKNCKRIMKQKVSGSWVVNRPINGGNKGNIDIIRDDDKKEASICMLGYKKSIKYNHELGIQVSFELPEKRYIKCIIDFKNNLGRVLVYKGSNIKILQNEGEIILNTK